jgi:predicted PhzF superfamily epimerase YddE/YHI9/ribosomal protein S18 acetylase RimI-like enzyme
MTISTPASTSPTTTPKSISSSTSTSTTTTTKTSSIFNNILFRNVCPTDLPAIYNLERASYPKDEAAPKSQLQYRQHHAAPFFRCAVYIPPEHLVQEQVDVTAKVKTSGGAEVEAGVGEKTETDTGAEQRQQKRSEKEQEHNNSDSTGINTSTNTNTNTNTNAKHLNPNRNSLNEIGIIIGFITATRCHSFTEKSMKTHDPSGSLLAIHSVVIDKKFQNQGIGQAMMKNYITCMEQNMESKIKRHSTHGHGHGGSSVEKKEKKSANPLITKIVLMSKIQNVPFYVKIGFQVLGPSDIVHGEEIWYDCCKELQNVKLFQLQKLQLQQQQQQQSRGGKMGGTGGNSAVNSLCWIVDSFAIPIYRRKGHSNSISGNHNHTNKKSGDASSTNPGTNSNSSAASVNSNASAATITTSNTCTESATTNNNTSSTTSISTVSILKESSSGNSNNSGSSVVSYQRGSGNPAAVVMVPNATPMTKIKRSSSFSQLLQLTSSTVGSTPDETRSASTSSSTSSTTANASNNNTHDASNFDPTSEENISWMKHIAKEFNLSETAFIWKCNNHSTSLSSSLPSPTAATGAITNILQKLSSSSTGSSTATSATVPTATNSNSNNIHYNIRYYTCDGTEIDLCGHATLAASSVIFQRLIKGGINNKLNANSGNSVEEIIFHAKNDVILKAKLNNHNGNHTSGRIGNSSGSGNNSSSSRLSQNLKIVMDFPTKEVIPFIKGTEEYTKVLNMLKEAFYSKNNNNDIDGDIKDSTIENYVEFIGIDDSGDDLLIELTSEGFSNVPRYREDINFKPMVQLSGYNRGVIICCEVSDDYHFYGETSDFMSRFFGPKAGIEEDPVTGSAHCVLGPYFSAKLGKTNIVGAQKSLRGGIVTCQIKDDGVIQIAGTAVTTMSGNLHM